MRKLIFFLITFILMTVLNIAAENAPSAQHRYRVVHHEPRNTFHHTIIGDENVPPREDRRRVGGYPAAGFRPAHPFDLPTEAHQPWTPDNAEQRRRPADTYGPPIVPHKPHENYGPPRDSFIFPKNNDNFDVVDEAQSDGTDYFHADYTDDQYPEQLQQPQQEQHQQAAQHLSVKSASYVTADEQQKQLTEDKLENFEIPLALLGAPAHSSAI